ncbi:MAG: copper chaperone PCu(A)C [Burkholderiales bacterium]|nr:copper chaperone PCu(A)C [Burkholderiales bacterium]
MLLPMAALAQVAEIRDAWIRGTVPAQQATGAFMQITGKVQARLVGVASPVAKRAEIHNMKMENNVMKMFPVDGIDVPAGATVKLAPGGYHVMLMHLHKSLSAGDKVPLQLTFELADRKRETVELLVEVRDVKGQPAKRHHSH